MEKAYAAALALYKPEFDAGAALAADGVFKKRKSMPHALGHGIGLEPHEGPGIRNRETMSGYSKRAWWLRLSRDYMIRCTAAAGSRTTFLLLKTDTGS